MSLLDDKSSMSEALKAAIIDRAERDSSDEDEEEDEFGRGVLAEEDEDGAVAPPKVRDGQEDDSEVPDSGLDTPGVVSRLLFLLEHRIDVLNISLFEMFFVPCPVALSNTCWQRFLFNL